MLLRNFDTPSRTSETKCSVSVYRTDAAASLLHDEILLIYMMSEEKVNLQKD